MPPIKGLHYGQRRYAQLQKAYSRAWRSLSAAERQQFGSYNNWRKSDAGRRVRQNFENTWLAENRPNSTDRPEPGTEPEPQPGPSTDFDLDDINLEDLFGSEFDNFFNNSDMADIQNNVPQMPTASSVAAGGGQTEPMDTNQLGSASGGPGGSSTSAAAPTGLSVIMPNPRLKTMHITFNKKWFNYTYGYAHTKLEGSVLVRYMTPYAYFPVDWVPWYISPQEFLSLPFNSKIVKVSTDIHIVGTRTAFDHGTTLSGTATTEYVPIIKWCVGMNNKTYLDNRPVKSESTEPMRPSGVKDKSLAEQFTMMYNPIGASEIPRHLNWYASILFNKTDGDYDGISTIQNYRLDKILKTGFANKLMHEKLIGYTYSPSNGYVKPTKKVILPMYNKDDDGFSDDVDYKQVYYKHQLPHILKITTDAAARGSIKVGQKLVDTEYNYVNRNTCNYYQSVEGYTFLNIHSGTHGTFRNQPQVHLGLLATPALNPGTEQTHFLNSSLYTVSYAECHVEFDMESMCVSGEPYEWPEDVL